MCTSSEVFSISSVSTRVGPTDLSLLPCTTDVSLLKVLTYIDLSATTIGISPKFSFYLLSIANAGSGLGRIASGILGDKFGAITIIAPLNLLCAIMTFVWPFATTKGSLIAIGIIYGFCSGAYVSLLAVPLLMMGDMHDAGRRTGIGMTGIALGALAGPPISGAIAKATGGFEAVGYYAGIVLRSLLLLTSSKISPLAFPPSGSCILAAAVTLYITKYLMIGSLRGKF
jgi:MCP family monocarboxylic acid transporter-like MFS transporter 10